MTPEIQALVTKLEKHSHKKCVSVNWEPLAVKLMKEAAAALVQQAQEKEQEEELTRVDEDTVMPPERATAAEHEVAQAQNPFCSVNPPSLFRAAQEALTFLDSVEWNDGTSETDAANIIEVLQEALEFAEDPDAVARVKGTSTSRPRALESEHLLKRLDEYDPDVSAGVAADAAVMIRDLHAQLARVTAEREEARAQFDRHVMWAAEQAEAAEAVLSARVHDYNNVVEALKVADRKGDDVMAALSAHREALEKLVEEWLELGRRERPLESAPITQEKHDRIAKWMMYTNRANELKSKLAALASPRQEEHEHEKDHDKNVSRMERQ